MKKIILALCFTLVMFTSVSATYPVIDIRIHNTSLGVQGLINYDAGYISGLIPGNYMNTINNTIVLTDYNGTCSLEYALQFPLNFTSSSSSSLFLTDSGLLTNYTSCTQERESYKSGLDNCNVALQRKGEFESNFSVCTSNLNVCNINVATQKVQIDNLNGGQNAKYWFGALGIIAGMVIQMYRKGDLGGANKKEDANYNQFQSR